MASTHDHSKPRRISHFITYFPCSALRTRVKFPFQELRPLCQLVLEIVLASRRDPSATVRWVAVLNLALRK